MNEILLWWGQLVGRHLGIISMAMASAIMVLSAPRLSHFLRGSLHGYPWIVRILAFIVMCAMGYGAITVTLGTLINNGLRDVSAEALGIVVLVVFVALGAIAERRGEM